MFEDRVDAGLKLCPKLNKYFNRKEYVVIGLLRGGLITAKAISDNLKLKLSPLMIKKIPAPGNSELAIGAMVSPKDVYLNYSLIKTLKISDFDLNAAIVKKWIELGVFSKKIKLKKIIVKNKNILLVDDGIATGATVLAANQYLRKIGAKSIVLITPVIAQDTFNSVAKIFNKVIFLIKTSEFYAVGQFYKNFGQISDEEIAKILDI